MKKLLTILICLMIFLSASACSKEDNAPLDESADILISFPDVGLENAILCEATERGIWLDESIYGQIFLLGKYKNDDDNVMMDHFLVIVTKDKTFYKDLTAYDGQINFAGNIEVCDLDGDGNCEVLLQQTIGMTGGAGSYLSRIFDYRDGELIELFSSDDIFDKYSRNMGFSCTLLENKEIKIDNEFTDYSETFSMSDRPDEYFKWWYNVDGGLANKEIMVDSFYEFVPKDTDEDGVFEIFCRQYVSLIGHSDGIGCTKIVLKYNVTTAEFEIFDASFELYKYEP